MKNIVIVGGGITGLAAAYEAVSRAKKENRPVRVTVLEQSHRFGGKIKSHETDDFVIEAGPDSIYTKKQGGMELIRELGLESDVVYSPTEMKTGILRRGNLFPLPPGMTFGLPTNIRSFAFNSLIPLSGKLRGLWDFLLPRDKDEEDKTIGKMLRRRIGNDLVDILAEPMLAGIHAGSVDRLSLNTVAPYLKKMEQDNRSLIRAMLKQGKASAASTAAKKPAFVSLKHGLQQLIDTLVDTLQADVTLRTNASVTNIERTQTGKFRLYHRDDAGNKEKLDADSVLLCVPAFAAKRLIPAPSQPIYEWLQQIPYVSTAAVSLVYPVKESEMELPYTGFLVPRGEDTILTACTVVSSKWSHSSHNGNIIVRGYVGRDGEHRGMAKSDKAIIKHVDEKMREYFGFTVNPVWSKVDRWPHAMPQYLVGHGEKLAKLRRQLAQDVPGMYLAGAGYNGMGIPDCIRQGREAMRECMDNTVVAFNRTPTTQGAVGK
ncbi:protoporphyrinogen oxidase [Alicyclobacillus sp. SO9]|uniref:protoporphyrinogen oxidase n=1 Tax=Alicyclobacillus sp. SO9 TaxID=2665646 RepID=UPI0018E7CB68|nr:protoporphyrinogen oxidase [Alicyclobacillus sp. SO9]QQE79119.1 protoporphyrinogen oxidase [Alicyclobacillus sp. SO9]